MRALSALALTLAAFPAGAQASKMTTFVAKGDGYTVAMPTTPRLATQVVSGVTSHIYIALTAPLVCIASKSNLPRSMDAINRQAMRKAMLASMMQTSGSTITRTRTAAHAGLSGQETDFKVAKGGTGTVWIAETPNAMYLLSAVGRTPAAVAQIAPFLASFHPHR